MKIIEARKISYAYPNMKEAESLSKASATPYSLKDVPTENSSDNDVSEEDASSHEFSGADTLLQRSKNASFALRDVSFEIEQDEFVAIIGPNGSGKSTLVRMLNALLLPSSGTILVDGKDTGDEANIPEIRSSVGMVFQNPDNQIIGAVVDEDVAFGPENLGVEPEKIATDVAWALKAVGMEDFADRSPQHLSGGQKQKVAIAGALAMRPKCLVLDEATSMLDPLSRSEVMGVVRKLNNEGTAVIMVTHNMEEAALASRVIVMEGGRIAADSRIEDSRENLIAADRKIEDSRENLIASEPTAGALSQIFDFVRAPQTGPAETSSYHEIKYFSKTVSKRKAAAMKIKLNNVGYVYASKTPYETRALSGVNLEISSGDGFISVIGRTGSGKSTLAQLICGLIEPSEGNISFAGADFKAEVKAGEGKKNAESLRKIRGRAALVFQFPEHQLFAPTVLEDVMFGPKNLGLSKDEAEKAARKALESVGVAQNLFTRSPFELSGGEMRRTAIAGVLAMNPKILVLDEPTAGLDPSGCAEILGLLKRLSKEGIGVVMITHDMKWAEKFSDRIIELDGGHLFHPFR